MSETATWALGKEDGQDFILCLRCDRKSFNQHDIDYAYCGLCGFHDPFDKPETIK